MASQLEKPRDVISGALVVACGVGFLYFGRGLTLGTASRMGPGYFPLALSLLMILLGLAIVVNGLRSPSGESVMKSVPWRSLGLVIGSVLFFALTLRELGLLISMTISTLMCAWASGYATWRSSIVLAVGLSIFCYVVFVYALGLPMPVIGRWFSPEYWSPSVSANP